LILPPQTATYHLFEALLTGDPTTIGDAFEHGAQNVGAALAQIPEWAGNVIDDILTANW
jgi:hypothetical protein